MTSETTHQSTPATEHHHGHRPHGDWTNEEHVQRWLEREQERAPARRRQFAIVRAVIPKNREDEFRYINLGAGPGNLDEVLLEHFPGATATLVDVSMLMLDTARQRLDRFGDRVEYVHANLATPDWTGAVSGPFDFALSMIAIHNLGDPRRIRELYAETYRLLGHGGMFLNLDIVRPARPSLAPLGPWAARDTEAALSGQGGGADLPASLLEQTSWLNEAGFACVDVLWKEMGLALVCGVRDHLHMPEGSGQVHVAGEGHAHSH